MPICSVSSGFTRLPWNEERIAKINQRFLRIVFGGLLKMKPITKPVLYLISALGLYYPLTLIAVKKR